MTLPMNRALRLLVALGLSVSLGACGDKDDSEADPSDDGAADGAADGASDGGAGDGADGGGGDAPAVSASALLDVAPLTLPEATGGALTATVLATALGADGGALPLDAAIAAVRFEARFDEAAEPAPVEAELGEDGALLLHFSLPGGLAPGGERRVVSILADGEPLIDVPVGLYGESDAFFDSLSAAPEGLLARGRTDGTLCDAAVVDADEDGVVEVLTLSVSGSSVLMRGCVAGDGSGRGGFTCADSTISVSGGDLVCGDTSHFLTRGGEVGTDTFVSTVRGELVHVSGPTWSGGAWTGTGTSTTVSAAGLFAVVLGLNNTKSEPADPDIALLTIGDDGRGGWAGVYQAGEAVGAWEAIGDVRPDTVGLGLGWAGLFGDADLSRGAGAGQTYAWSLDPRGAASSGTVKLSTASWAAGVGFVRARDVAIDAPPFAVEHAAAAGEDLDGDGVPELIVELWGEGQWVAWALPAVTDKASTARPRRLLSAAAHNVGFGAAVSLSGDGRVAVASSSFRLGGDGVLQATLPMLKGMEYTPVGPPSAVVTIGETWSVDALMVADAASVASVGGGVLGEVPASGAALVANGRGFCSYGRCFASPGFGSSERLLLGGGDGSGPLSLAAGALAYLGETPEGDALVLTAGLSTEPTPLLAVKSSSGLHEVGRAWDAEGPHLTLDGRRWVNASPVAVVSVGLEADGETLRPFVFEPTTEAAAATLAPRARAIPPLRYALRVEGADEDVLLELSAETARNGGSRPVVTIRGPQIIAWRVSGGQLYLGGTPALGDSDSRVDEPLRFGAGPVAVGWPLVDRDNALGLSAARPGVVGLSSSLPDSPPLAPAGLEDRLSRWDEPMEVPFAGYDKTYEPIYALVGDETGGAEVWLIPAADALLGADPIVVSAPGAALAELMVPELSLRALADGPPALLSTSASGLAELAITDGRTQVARTALGLALPAQPGGIGAGDLNGDGLSDVIVGVGSAASVHLSDGRGGLLDVDGPAASALANFGALLGGGGEGDECPVEPMGGGLDTRGRALIGPTAR